MSVPTYLQSSAVPFSIGTDGITYKQAVCKKLSGLQMTPTLIEDESDCGPATATGTKKFSFNAELLLNLTPNGATELSLNEIATWANNGTTVYVLFQYGSSYYRQGAGVISNYQESLPLNGFVSATFTVSGTGLLDLTP
jgi:hypothetical protein